MIDYIKQSFAQKKPNYEKLLSFGFVRKDNRYVYQKAIINSGLIQYVTVTKANEVSSVLVDAMDQEPYTLHLTAATGDFVGYIRNCYEETLKEIAEACFEADVYQRDTTKQLIAYVKETYGDELEFLWASSPDSAIWRRSDNKKWYGAILVVSMRKLGLLSDEQIEILDVRVDPQQIGTLVDHVRYFPGYHMNKKNWVTILLNGSVPLSELSLRIHSSYDLAKK